jgi:hypothetical protein
MVECGEEGGRILRLASGRIGCGGGSPGGAFGRAVFGFAAALFFPVPLRDFAAI